MPALVSQKSKWYEKKKKKKMYIGVGKKWSYSILMTYSENNKVWSSL